MSGAGGCCYPAGDSDSAGQSPGGCAGGGSNGNRGANAGSRSDSHTAAGSNRAKNRRPTGDGSQAWIMCKTKTFSPAIWVTPSTQTLPDVVCIDGPRQPITPSDWLATPAQRLAEVTAGAVFHDGPGELSQARARLAWYPCDVWLYVLACQWQRIA
jgi:hypothetical protein